MIEIRNEPVIEIVDYDPSWPRTFGALRDRAWPLVAEWAESIEHVGSTSVPGLAAKPIVDMTIVLRSAAGIAPVIHALATLGYRHQGDLGIAGREAFIPPKGDPAHHLYVCVRGADALADHLDFREYLRAHGDQAAEYSKLKRRLAAAYREDREGYTEAKFDFIRACLADAR